MDRIGLHTVGPSGLHLGRPRLVKLADVSVDYVRDVRKAVGPECIIVVRWVAGDHYPLDNPVQRAREWVGRYLPEMRAMAEGDPNVVFEGYNEIGCGKALPDREGPDCEANARAYAAHECERLRLMHEAGLRTCWGNFAPGNPHENYWPIFKPVINAMALGDFLGLHEYWGIHGEIDMPYLCGRWKWAPVAPYLKGVPIIVSEIGRGEGGWKGPYGISPAQYLAELEKYDAMMASSPNVLGGTVFTARGYGWDAYHPDEIWSQVVGRYTGAAWTDPSYKQEAPAPEPTYLGPDPTVGYYHSDRHGYAPEWLIIHDTEGPAAAALAWWRSPNNPRKSSAHWLVKADGAIVPVVPEHLAAHHAGGGAWPGIPTGSIGGTSIINLVSIGIELEYPLEPASPPWPATQLDKAVGLARRIAAECGIPRDHVLRHSEVNPQAKTDPRNFDWQGFLGRVFAEDQAAVEQAIRNAAWQALGVPYNPDAAFARYAREHELGNPVTGEVDVDGHRLQGFAGGIVWAKVGDWSNIKESAW